LRIVAGVLVVALLAAGGFILFRDDGPKGQETRIDPVDPCTVPRAVLEKVWRGYVPGRSGDVLAIEQLPNQFGTRHSTPWPYTQDIPLVFWGPGYIKKGFVSDDPVTLADVSPTYADLLQFDEYPVEKRDGIALSDALLEPEKRGTPPKLIFTVVWDGGGINVLRQWPDDWPFLKKLMKEGANFTDATVGSSPSITPATHSTLGTGTFPDKHGLTDIKMRIKGKIVDAFAGSNPSHFKLPTLGDLWDLANDNVPVVGMMARDSWHLGMLGHGAFLEDADKDVAVMDQLSKGLDFRTNPEFYRLPNYLSQDGLQEAADALDQKDGEADGQWLGNQIIPLDGRIRYSPAWNVYQMEQLELLIENEELGVDDVPDLFYVNYKSTDLAGHEWNMLEAEVRQDLAAQDLALKQLVKVLNREVGRNNYVLSLTADHGMTPLPESTGGWSIDQSELAKDLEARFDKETPDVPIVMSNRGYQYMLSKKELKRNGITVEDVVEWMKSYSIGDNAKNDDLGDFADKADERIFLTVLTPRQLEASLSCSDES
jgi:hypothetical protein